MRSVLCTLCLILICLNLVLAQESVSEVWVSDLGNGTYKNPIIHADYSDPDVCRVGEDYYMTASSFDAVPGLPILHSKDLVNWQLIGHALKRQPPFDHFSRTQHGNGVWAPSIRYDNNTFYIFYPDPDFGIYLTKSKEPTGPWSELTLIMPGKGLIDPCPLWDDDGKLYLAYAFAGSRAGIKSVLAMVELDPTNSKPLNEGRIVYDGHELDPTIEGPKLYKRNGFYYIFAPAGGVSTGWQTILRSKSINGPYERKVVLDQGATSVNGPHQGAWVDTETGEEWFIHFQDQDAYGRVVHLQPMNWINDWPVIGLDQDGDGKGEPVMIYKKPNVGRNHPIKTPPESDEFNALDLGLQWQWQANPKSTWAFMNVDKGSLRLYSDIIPEKARNYWEVPNILMQKWPAEEFMATTKVSFSPNPKLENEKTGLIVMGQSYAYLALKSTKEGTLLVYTTCQDADQGNDEQEQVVSAVKNNSIYLRLRVTKEAKCRFAYSLDGEKFMEINEDFHAEAGRWIGAKMGMFCTRSSQTNDAGYADFDWFSVEQISNK